MLLYSWHKPGDIAVTFPLEVGRRELYNGGLFKISELFLTLSVKPTRTIEHAPSPYSSVKTQIALTKVSQCCAPTAHSLRLDVAGSSSAAALQLNDIRVITVDISGQCGWKCFRHLTSRGTITEMTESLRRAAA